MKFDHKKVHLLLGEMEVVLSDVKAIRQNFERRLAEKRKKAA